MIIWCLLMNLFTSFGFLSIFSKGFILDLIPGSITTWEGVNRQET